MGKFRELFKSSLPESLKYRSRIIRKYQKKRRIEKKLAGDRVKCIICGKSYHEFEFFKLWENEKCPSCLSMKRHRLLYHYLINETRLFSTSKKIRLLHFAPERAFFDIFSKFPNIEYYPCDLEPENYKFYRKTKIHKVDITKIDFNDEKFDVILCNHVLEHIIDDHKAMKELYRVLRKDGWGILQVPIDFNRSKTYEDATKTTPEERYAAFGQMDHVRWYGQDYPDKLREAGFRVDDIKYTAKFSPEEKFIFGFPQKESIYLCHKK